MRVLADFASFARRIAGAPHVPQLGAAGECIEVGSYTLEQKTGQGGMGVVYRARHALQRRTAFSNSAEFSTRLFPGFCAMSDVIVTRTKIRAVEAVVAVRVLGKAAFSERSDNHATGSGRVAGSPGTSRAGPVMATFRRVPHA
jgi:hypothetical protein